MLDAINYSFMIFSKWLDLVFNWFSFNYQSFNVSLGWLIIGVWMIEIIINSILNIPSRLPNKAYYSSHEYHKVETSKEMIRYNRRRTIANIYNDTFTDLR